MTHQPFVYGLYDSIDVGHIRYVGMAPSNPSRPHAHAKRARTSTDDSHLLRWIRKIQAEGREPSVIILEQLSVNNSLWLLGEIEKMYIASLIKIGHKLTNVSKGGIGRTGPQTEETKQRISESKLGHETSLETREKIRNSCVSAWTPEMRESMRCKKLEYFVDPKNREKRSEDAKKGSTSDVRAKHSLFMKGKQYALGHVVSEEAREEIRKKLTGRKQSLETVAKRVASIKANHSTDSRLKRSAALKAAWARRKATRGEQPWTEIN